MPALTQGGAAGNSHVTLTVLIGFIALIAGLGLGYVLAGFIGSKKLEGLKAEAEVIASRAKEDATNAADKILIEADRNALARKEAVDKELEAARNEQREFERRLAKREDILDRKEETLSHKESNLSEQSERVEAERERLRAREAELTDLKDKQQRELEREILINAIQRYANEHSSETTVRTVAIPSDDMKGRIIGREGRNIRAIEKATGADIIVDDTPGVIVVSCFDKVRQAIAVESLERLIADGRMHPTRIEEVVEKVTGEVGEKIIKAGKDAAVELGLKGLHPKIIEAMGRLTYRTSYGQNVLKHSMEVAYLCQIIADQLGLDGKLAKRCGFLHDIGKAMDHEMEGGHPKIGMDFARQYGEKEEAVLNAIGAHHADMPSTTWYTPIVMAADAVSAARPGARRESMERYIQRLNDLQDIALAIPGVSEAYAVQAGREVRVMIDADRISDDESYLIAHEIAKRVSNEMTFPGEIRVTVLRETRAIEIAR